MGTLIKLTQLYRFLRYCQVPELGRVVLDCGAGGELPPLVLFSEHGYETYGIEYDDNQLKKANQFEKEQNVKLNIIKGDMRNLPYDNNSIDYVYSCNSIFHMTKKDIIKSVNEIKRVLKPKGRCFVNFLSINDFQYGKGQELEKGEFLQVEGQDKVVHTYFEIDEGDILFSDMNILLKENRVLERVFYGEKIKQGFIDYIVEKKAK